MEYDTTRAVAPAEQQKAIKACDMCRKRKVRCEPTEDGCIQCAKSRTQCHFTPISTRKISRRPAGYKYISKLEERLKKLECLLPHTTGKNGLQKDGQSQQMLSSFGVLNFEPNKEKGDHLPNLTTTDSQQWQQNSGISTNFNQNEIDLPNLTSHKLSDTDVLANEAPGLLGQPSPSWKGRMALGPFSLPSFHKLPSKPVALELVEDAFKSFNNFFPLFDEQEFLHQFHHQYTESSPSDPAWWACINVVLSLAHRFRAMRTLQTIHENTESCGYIHNALAVVSELSVLPQSLPAVQALLGMAIILQGSPNPQASSVLTAAAVRLAQAMGLHRSSQNKGLFVQQVEQRKRVFWAAYLLDKDISLRMGQPFAQDDDDMDAELPSENPTCLPLIGLGTEFRTVNFFNSRIGLAVIQGQVYKRLYSVQASRQSETQKAVVAHELSSVLSYWRSSVPIDFEDGLVVPFQTPLSVEFIHMLILRFTYVNCLVMIDRHISPPDTTSAFAPDIALYESPMPEESLCVVESRKAVRLIQVTPPGDYACVWILLHPFFAAVEVLLHNLIRNPASPQAPSDLHIVKPFIDLLEMLAGEKRQCSRSVEAERMYELCKELNGRAHDTMNHLNMSLDLELFLDMEQ